jgi:hypothetical protein
MLVEAGATVDGEVVTQVERLVHDMGLSPELANRLKGEGAT